MVSDFKKIYHIFTVLKDRSTEMCKSEEHKGERLMKKENSLRDLLEAIK